MTLKIQKTFPSRSLPPMTSVSWEILPKLTHTEAGSEVCRVGPHGSQTGYLRPIITYEDILKGERDIDIFMMLDPERPVAKGPGR